MPVPQRSNHVLQTSAGGHTLNKSTLLSSLGKSPIEVEAQIVVRSSDVLVARTRIDAGQQCLLAAAGAKSYASELCVCSRQPITRIVSYTILNAHDAITHDTHQCT
eukprot:1156858-Pelagomonas_calceolata.AAC.3